MDYLHYVTVGNPVSKAVISAGSTVFRGKSQPAAILPPKSVETVASSLNTVMPPLWKLAGRHYDFVRIAGISGAAAVILGAIGSHKLATSPEKTESSVIFQTANRFHFFHSIALLGMPLAKRPALTGILMISGTALFTGTLYYRALTGDKRFSRLAPTGGMLLIAAWLSLVF